MRDYETMNSAGVALSGTIMNSVSNSGHILALYSMRSSADLIQTKVTTTALLPIQPSQFQPKSRQSPLFCEIQNRIIARAYLNTSIYLELQRDTRQVVIIASS